MNTQIDIPDEVIVYILFQRSAHIKFARGHMFSLLNKLSPWSFYEKALRWEASIRKDSIKRLYQNDILEDYESIQAYLPADCRTLLDIGCGIGGIDILLYRHYAGVNNIQVYLLDRTQVDKSVYYGYKPKGSFYNSLESACQFLTHNEIPRECIHPRQVAEDYHIDVPEGIDLIVSLTSWGFHYPISTYLNQVYTLLRKGGRLILDIRPGTQGEEELKCRFSSVQEIPHYRPNPRFLAIK
jgi:SAM-dependent methyltransferase